MTLRRKLLAYGILGVLSAGLGWLWAWNFRPKGLWHHTFPMDKRDG